MAPTDAMLIDECALRPSASQPSMHLPAPFRRDSTLDFRLNACTHGPSGGRCMFNWAAQRVGAFEANFVPQRKNQNAILGERGDSNGHHEFVDGHDESARDKAMTLHGSQ